MLSLIVTTAARLEEREASEWYASKDPALVPRFRAELKSVLRRIQATPQQFPSLEGAFQRAVPEKFPYSIIFEHTGSTILVLPIAHNSRKPMYWRNRRPVEGDHTP